MPDDVALVGQRVRVDHTGDAEVHDLDPPADVDHHVLRFDVAMDDALAVRVGEGVEQLHPDGGHVGVAELALELRERAPLDELPDEVAALAVAEVVVQGDDVRVREGGRGVDLAHHPRRHAAPLGDDLERDAFSGAPVEGLEDLGEASAAEASDDLVALAPREVQRCRCVGCCRQVQCSAHPRGGAPRPSWLGIRYGTIHSLYGPLGEWRNWQTR